MLTAYLFQLPVALHAVLLIGDETPAGGALDHFDRQFLLAELASGIFQRNDLCAVRTSLSLAFCQDRREKKKEEDNRGQEKADQSPRQLIPALLICDQSPGQARDDEDEKPIHLFSSQQEG